MAWGAWMISTGPSPAGTPAAAARRPLKDQSTGAAARCPASPARATRVSCCAPGRATRPVYARRWRRGSGGSAGGVPELAAVAAPAPVRRRREPELFSRKFALELDPAKAADKDAFTVWGGLDE